MCNAYEHLPKGAGSTIPWQRGNLPNAAKKASSKCPLSMGVAVRMGREGGGRDTYIKRLFCNHGTNEGCGPRG